MINLLPPYQKKQVAEERRWKAAFVLLFFALVFSLSLSISLFFAKENGGEMLMEEIEVVRKEREKIPDISNKEEQIKEFNNLISQLDSFYSGLVDLENIFKEIYDILPSETQITKFRFEKDKVVLSGYASDWYSLNETEEKFKEQFSADFSPESWTKTEDINFLISFKVK